jgi:hypothetical protein
MGNTKLFFVCFMIGSISLGNPLPFRTGSGYKHIMPQHIYGALPSCTDMAAVSVIIEEAIAIGALTYNAGNHLGCYRIYEGAAYKILYEHGSKCKDVRNLLKEALDLSYKTYSDSEKAWVMRMAFDRILGVPTVTK